MSRLFDASFIIAEREKAILWAMQRLAQVEAETDPEFFCILDTETTGMGNAAEPVQITMIDHEGKPLLNTYVKPGCKIEYGASKVHGISDSMVRNAPTFPQVMGDFRRIVGDKVVICWNLVFDRRIIRQTVAKYRLPPPMAVGYECAMLRYAQFKGTPKPNSNDFRWHTLSNACEQCEIPREGAHESLVDCTATLQIIQHMALANNSKKPAL